jgi:hypothetical protein
MIRTEQHGSADLGFSKAVSTRRGVIRDPAMQRITGIITASLPEPDGARSVHWNAAKTDHRTPFEVRYEGSSMISNRVSFFPPIALLF